MKNILLTTLGYTKDMIDMEYFHFCKPNGDKTYCTGISVAEAGTKYILSNFNIDEIIVLGPPDAISDKDIVESQKIIEMSLYDSKDVKDYSEYGFFCYRMLQFVEGIDIEANDIFESLDKKEYDDVYEKFDNFKRNYKKNVSNKDLFWQIDDDGESTEAVAEMKSSLNRKQWNWLRYSGYNMMDSFYKMHSMNANRDISVRFLPVQKNENGAFDIQNLNELAGSLIPGKDFKANFYMDLQGMDFCDGYTFFNILSMLRHSTDNRINIAGIIQSTETVKRLSATIVDEWSRLEMHELLTGVNVFLNYGKSDYVCRYWESHGFKNQLVERMLGGMKYVDEGISVCNIPVLKYGISVIRRLFKENPPESSGEFGYSVLASTIQKDYGDLLEGEDVSVVALLKWLIRKQMYQQALTIVESHIPEDMVKRGIFYYAQSYEDIKNMMKEINVLYWNEMPRNRYCFNDLSHYFIKNYGRSVVNFRQKKDAVNRDLAHIKVSSLHGYEELLPAYSNLNDDDMLYELLLSYYNISLVRNEVCHSLPPENALSNAEEFVPASNLDMLKDVLERFSNMYSSAVDKLDNNGPEPVLIDPSEFRAYTMKNKLQPLENTANGVLENSSVCVFNGKEVTVHIKMLSPQDDYPKF